MDDDFAAEIQNIEEEIARNRVEQPPQQFTTTNPHFKPPIGNVFAQAPPQHPVIGEESGMSAFSSNAREYVPPTAEASQHPFGGSSGMQVATRGGQGPLPGAHSFSKDSDERSIFVGNLPKNVPITPEELTAFFGECGPVLNCTILKDRVTHEPKGTAYIEFASYVAMGRALDTMNNAMFKGSAIIVC